MLRNLIHRWHIKHNANGNVHIKLHHDQTSLRKRAGHSNEMAEVIGKRMTVSLPAIEAVGIRHLVEVEPHVITTVAGSRSHVVRFANGGWLRFAYNSAGALIELSAENLTCLLAHGNEALFYIPTAEESAAGQT